MTLPYRAGWHTSGAAFMVFRTGILLMLALWLSACASVESFRKMTPAQRAREVHRHRCLHQLRATSASTRKAAEIRQVLDRGYRLHESCRTVEASKAPEIVCRPAPAAAATRGAAKSRTANTSASAGIFRCRSTAHWKRKTGRARRPGTRPRHLQKTSCISAVTPGAADVRRTSL